MKLKKKNYIKFNNKFDSSFFKEYFHILDSDLIEQVTGMKELKSSIKITFPYGEFPIVPSLYMRLSSDKVDDIAINKVRIIIEKYLDLRWVGHSESYAFYSVFTNANYFPETIIQQYPGLNNLREPSTDCKLAYPWIRFSFNEDFTYPGFTKEKEYNIIIVVDGELAWLYTCKRSETLVESNSLKHALRPMGECFDALEFSPAFAGICLQTIESVKKRSASFKNASQRWSFITDFLEKKYHIKWRSPYELNPYITYD